MLSMFLLLALRDLVHRIQSKHVDRVCVSRLHIMFVSLEVFYLVDLLRLILLEVVDDGATFPPAA